METLKFALIYLVGFAPAIATAVFGVDAMSWPGTNNVNDGFITCAFAPLASAALASIIAVREVS